LKIFLASSSFMEKVEKFCLIEECFLKLFLFKNILKFKPGKKIN
jgi:hypothetical protein